MKGRASAVPVWGARISVRCVFICLRTETRSLESARLRAIRASVICVSTCRTFSLSPSGRSRRRRRLAITGLRVSSSCARPTELLRPFQAFAGAPVRATRHCAGGRLQRRPSIAFNILGRQAHRCCPRHLRQGRRLACDDRRATGHRFQHGQAETFIDRWIEKMPRRNCTRAASRR